MWRTRSSTVILAVLLLGSVARADYVTPGTGEHLTMADLVALSGGAVTGSGSQFEVHQTVTVAITDTLSVTSGQQLTFLDATGLVELSIAGALLAYGAEEDSIRFTSQNQNIGDFYGLQYRDTGPGSDFQLHYCIVEYARKAVDIYAADGTVTHCRLQHTSEDAVELTSSNSTVSHCVIHHNFQNAVSMTLSSSPTIEYNVFTDNNWENSSPFVHINIGLQGVNSPIIRGNTIMGGNHMSGGIAIWNSSSAVIEDNHIENCGYGILCYQFDANPLIKDNVLLNNNIHPDTLNWGFGIACNGQNAPIITGNEIQGHWYGVAIINGAQPNCGDLVNDFPGDDGGNLFLGNGLNGEMYELFNNNGLDIMAQNNWWGTDDPVEIEDRIVHFPDNPAYGVVTFEPFLSGLSTVGDHGETDLPPVLLAVQPAYPNPFNPRVSLRFTLARRSHVTVQIFDIRGRWVRTLMDEGLEPGPYAPEWDGTTADLRAAASGTYFYRIVAGRQQETGKILLAK
jgi:parallel beta-helix repeat protein